MYHFGSSEGGQESIFSNGVKPTSNGVKAEKRQITRNRTSYSCITCRRRKVKCDKARPICGGCQKAGEECIYSQEDGVAAGVQNDAWKDDGVLGSKKRKTSPTREASSSISNPSDVDGNNNLKAIEDQLQRLTRMIDALRSPENDLKLREFITPVASTSPSDRSSEGAQPRPSLSLDMFQSNNQAVLRDPSELTKPMSTLKIANSDARFEDPFWSHISDEVDQLNHLMRRRANNYLSATNPQVKACDEPRNWVTPPPGDKAAETEDFWEPISFHKEGGLDTTDRLDVDCSCPICRSRPSVKSSLLQSGPINCSPASAIRYTMQHLPTRTQSNVLFRCWLSGVYPVLGLVLPAEILKKYDAFWDEMDIRGESESTYRDLDFLAVVNAIWYAGTLSISTKGLRRWFPNVSRAKLSSQFHDQVVFCLNLGSFKRSTSLYKLASFVLLQSMPAAEEDPIQGSLYLQLAVRLALAMGLHREPTLFDLSTAEEGTRRRLWWQIIQLDVSLSVACGFPSQISEAFCDTRIMCEDHDSYSPDDGTQSSPPSDRNSKGSSPHSSRSTGDGSDPMLSFYRTGMLFARGKSIMACALRSVVSIHLGTRMLTNTDTQEIKRIMTQAGDQVNAIIKLIPTKGLPELGFIPDAPREGSQSILDCDVLMGNSISMNEVEFMKNDIDQTTPLANYYRQRQAAYHKWARITLSMLVDKIHCVSYAPFLKNTKSKLWSVGRQCALHNCHSFMRKFISLATDPDLECFRWSWPAMYGPMHAALIVLVDLFERPSSVEAPRSRELIDKMFALAAPESGIVGGPDGVSSQRPLREGGLEPWDMLRGLRSTAWQKAGLDPTVLWTEADQLDLGVATPLTDAQRIAQSLREDTIYENDRPLSNGSLPAKGSATHPRSSEQGVRYMVKLAQHELIDPAESEALPCTRTSRKQFLQTIENDARLNANRGLARREGQQKMPFPLNGVMEACSGAAARGDVRTGMTVPIHSMIPRPDGQTLTCSGNGPCAGEPVPGYPNRETPSVTSQRGQDSGDQPINGVASAQQAESHDHRSQNSTNGPTHGNGVQNGFTGDVPDHSLTNGWTRDQVMAQEELLHHDSAPSSDAELGFDWERWDAVFGQYSGFTDMMEDVTWNEYVDA